MKKSDFFRLTLFIGVICLMTFQVFSVSHHPVCWGQDLSQFPQYIAPTAIPQYPPLWEHTFLASSYIPGFNSLTDRARYVYFTWPGFSVVNSFGLSGIELSYSYIFPFNLTSSGYYLFPEWKIPPAVPSSLAQWPPYAVPPNLWFPGFLE